MRPGFWSEPVRLFLMANGRQDLVDRGDALAQRVAALLLAARERLDQYARDGHLYDGHGGDSAFPAAASGPAGAAAALAELEEFVNVRLREEIAVLESVLAVFDDLQDRDTGMHLEDLCSSLKRSLSGDPNVIDVAPGASPDGTPCVLALTATDPGSGGHGLRMYGHPFLVRRAPRALRRIASCKVL